MKAIRIITAIILLLQMNVLLADNESSTAPVSEAIPAFNVTALAPSVPAEATFEETLPDNTFFWLSPVTPVVASFDDVAVELVPAAVLSPETPDFADFEDID